MLPKAFMVEDLSVGLARTMADLQALRKRMDATALTIATQGKRIEALRKRMERYSAKQKLRPNQRASE